MPGNHNSSKRKTHHSRASRPRGWGVFGVLLLIALIAVAAIIFNQAEDGEAIPAAQPAEPTTLPLEITVEEAHQQYQAGVFFLDVREQEEWDAFHIPNTTLIPLSELPNRLGELPRDKQIVVVCRSGNRSQTGRDTLLQAGFVNVTSMAGGVTGWSNAGFPIDGKRP